MNEEMQSLTVIALSITTQSQGERTEILSLSVILSRGRTRRQLQCSTSHLGLYFGKQRTLSMFSINDVNWKERKQLSVQDCPKGLCSKERVFIRKLNSDPHLFIRKSKERKISLQYFGVSWVTHERAQFGTVCIFAPLQQADELGLRCCRSSFCAYSS